MAEGPGAYIEEGKQRVKVPAAADCPTADIIPHQQIRPPPLLALLLLISHIF